MFDNRWDNWAGDFAESFAATAFDVGSRGSIAAILHEFGSVARRSNPDFPDAASPETFRAIFADHLARLNLTPAARQDAPEIIAQFCEYLQDGGRLGDGHEWAVTIRNLKIPEKPAAAKPLAQPAAPIRNTPQTSVGRNDPCPCGSGKKYKKCCYA